MTIYVDDIVVWPSSSIKAKAQKFGNSWCHMWTDSDDIEELHEFAAHIGLKRSWFQNKPIFPHYDLVVTKRELAIKNGAQLMPLREWWRKKRKK